MNRLIVGLSALVPRGSLVGIRIWMAGLERVEEVYLSDVEGHRAVAESSSYLMLVLRVDVGSQSIFTYL
ncbi:hypothetical protein HZZ02_06635 [Streptococcus danieliae]|nr:hypothetical protein [Streptococcus danieliae]